MTSSCLHVFYTISLVITDSKQTYWAVGHTHWLLRWNSNLGNLQGHIKDKCLPAFPVKLFSGAWWCHQMEAFSMLLAICAGNSPVPGEFPTQRQVTRSFDVFFDLRLNKWLSKQPWGWWFETPSRSLWRYRNEMSGILMMISQQWSR